MYRTVHAHYIMNVIIHIFLSGYEATPYELLQMPHSSGSTQSSSLATSRPDSSNSPHHHRPPQPLQLGRLTSELYKLHSSSTHSLTPATYSRDHKGSGDSMGTAMSLQDLDKFVNEDNSLDAYTQPSISLTNRGKGTFLDLFLPPPLIPLPKIKKKPSSQLQSRSSSPSGGGKITPPPKKGSRTPSPNLQRSQGSGSVGQSQPQSQPTSALVSPSSSSLSRLAHKSHTTSSKSVTEEGDRCLTAEARLAGRSKAAQKLLQKRAKFCTPGTCNYMYMYMYMYTTAFLALSGSESRHLGPVLYRLYIQ